MKIKLIVAIFCLFCCVFCDDEKRKLSVVLNPDCEVQIGSQCEDLTFVHVQAETADSVLNYLWDFTGTPSIFLAKTNKNNSLYINWGDFMLGTANSISFYFEPEYIFSAVISKIYLFNDPKDKADVNDESVSEVITIDPHAFKWTLKNLTQLDDQVVLDMGSSVHNSNGSFSVKLSAFGSTKHGDELPHLYHSAHSMQVDLIVKNFTSNYSNPRIAIEYLMVSSESKKEGSFKLNKRRNLDDEFTPGIFDVYDVVSPRSNNDSRGSFFQYRPVCYTTEGRTVSDSTELKQGDIRSFNNNHEEIAKFTYTLPYMFYGYTFATKIAQGSNITLGLTGDGFYSKTNYTSFSMLMGVGAPPIEKLSMFVKTFAIIGLGVPLLVLLVGGVYVALKRYNRIDE